MIGSSLARIEERLTDGDVVVVEVVSEPLLGHGLQFLKSRGPDSSAAVRMAVVYYLKEGEGERQKEVQEDEGNEEKESEVYGEVEENQFS